MTHSSTYQLDDSTQSVKVAIETSQFLKDVAEVRRVFSWAPDTKYRKLLGAEKWQMERQGVRATDWDTVLVVHDFESSRVMNCTLQGNIRLGNFSGKIHLKRRSIKLPAGVYNCDLKDVVVEDGALVSRTSLLNNVHVGADACVMGCGEVTCSGDTVYGNGLDLSLAIETGGRETRVFAEMTVKDAAGVACSRADKAGQHAYHMAIQEYIKKATSPATIIGRGSRVMHTPKVTNVYMGPGAIIDSAVCVEDVTMLSTLIECSMILAGCSASHTLMQWGSTIEGLGLVSRSVLCEYSTVRHHGKVAESVVGPHSHVAEGECTATLCGPFVLLDHQALLIACLWPEGKGSVGYGANVGSNHTSKAPDQEFVEWRGQAPYSIVGSGVITLPQTMSFPFSLISSPSTNISGISPAFNEIIPGWCLDQNIDSLRRNENRMIKTNRAKRQAFVFDLLRPETVDMMKKARAVLVTAENRGTFSTEKGEMVYTEKQMKGVGKNYVRESKRVLGINTYTFYIQYYCLMGLYEQLKKGAKVTTVLTTPINDHFWAHQCPTLAEECPGVPLSDLLSMLLDMKAKITMNVRDSKERDDALGRTVIGDYDSAHRPAGADPFILESELRMAEVDHVVRTMIADLALGH